MKKEKQEIATNLSSGAEKVEKVTKQTEVKKTQTKPASSVNKQSAQGDAALGSANKRTEKKTERVNAKKVNAQSAGSKAEKESAAAKARVERALKKKEEKAKKKAEKIARTQKRKEERAKKKAESKKKLAMERADIEKRKAQKKADAEKRAAERKALAEKRAAAREERIRNRAKAKAERNQARAQKRAEEQKRRKQNRRKQNKGDERKRNTDGYGGWIAAVTSLGVVTLALATTVTVGAVEMRKERSMMMGENRRTMYELTGIMENVDNDLDRVRISNSTAQQSRILTDLLVQARLAELDLEKMPISAQASANVTGFINRTAHECERMLSKLRRGETLSATDYQTLESLYKTNHQIRASLDELCVKATDKDWSAFMKKGKGNIFDAIGKMEELTLEENRASFDRKKEEMHGAGMRSMPKMDSADGEFSHIDPAQAEELCKQYFPKVNVAEYRCIGETVGKGYSAYNVQGYDDKGTQLFAEISQADGKLLRFDYYEDCMGDTFDYQNAERIAEEFLQSLGYEDLEVVRLRENGSNVDFTFVYEDDGVVYYPDEIRVKVCRNRGLVTGMDATKYLARHRERTDVEPSVSLADAYDKLHDKLGVISSRLAVVDTARGERIAYEFLCAYGEENYFIFLDAKTGDEIAIINTKTAQ